MDFITGAFLLFFTICVAVYYSIPKKGQWIWLLLCSIFFYLCASVKLSIFILFSIISSFVAARRLEQLCAREQAVREKTDPDQKKETDVNVHKKAVAALLIGSNAGLLFLLKFASSGSFFVTRLHLGRLAFLLPMGISFYTLQIIAYVVDVYRGKYPAEKNFIKAIKPALHDCALRGKPKNKSRKIRRFSGFLYALSIFFCFLFLLCCLFLRLVLHQPAEGCGSVYAEAAHHHDQHDGACVQRHGAGADSGQIQCQQHHAAAQPQAAAVHLLLPLLPRRERMLLRLALPGLLFPDVITLKRIHVPVAPSLSFSLRVLYAARWDDVQKEVDFSLLASHICAERPKPARNIGYSPIYFLRAEE